MRPEQPAFRRQGSIRYHRCVNHADTQRGPGVALFHAEDGDPDREDGGDAEPSVGAPESHASQIIWLRGGDRDLEGIAPKRVCGGGEQRAYRGFGFFLARGAGAYFAR